MSGYGRTAPLVEGWKWRGNTEMTAESLTEALRREAREAPESGIVEVFNYGRTRPGLIPLWAGEGDLPTPDFISDAVTGSLRKRRDLLHLPARHSRAPRGARPLSRADLRPPLFARALLRHRRRRHAGDPDRAPQGRRRRRRGHRADPRLAEHRRRGRGRRRHRQGSADALRQSRAGTSTSTASSPPPVRGRVPSSSIRPPTRPAGRRPSTSLPPSSPSRASVACGSSPTRSIIASTTLGRVRPPSTISPRTTTGSCRSTPSPRTGR